MNDVHTREVEKLLADFGAGRNSRVPMSFCCDEQVWLAVAGRGFREFYTDPETHLAVQLEGKRWFCDNVVGDMPPGYPDCWQIGVQLWMEENEFFGCEVVYQEDDYAWGQPLPLDREDLLRHLSDIDPDEQVRRGSAFAMYQALVQLAAGRTFEERPIVVAPPGGGTHGIFTKAAEIRGLDAICIDLIEVPDFVDKLLEIVTEKTIARIKAWHKLIHGAELELPTAGGFSFCDDSLTMISPETYEKAVLPHHQRLCDAMTTGPRGIHLCGRASQHYPTLRHKLNVTHIDGPGPFVDHGFYLKTLGPRFAFTAQTDHSVLAYGSPQDIDTMMRGLLTPEAKVPGRFSILGYVTKDTPLENVRACYDAARRYGTISA